MRKAGTERGSARCRALTQPPGGFPSAAPGTSPARDTAAGSPPPPQGRAGQSRLTEPPRARHTPPARPSRPADATTKRRRRRHRPRRRCGLGGAVRGCAALPSRPFPRRGRRQPLRAALPSPTRPLSPRSAALTRGAPRGDGRCRDEKMAAGRGGARLGSVPLPLAVPLAVPLPAGVSLPLGAAAAARPDAAARPPGPSPSRGGAGGDREGAARRGRRGGPAAGAA